MIYMAVRRIPADENSGELDYPDESSLATSRDECQRMIERHNKWSPRWAGKIKVIRIGQFKVTEIMPGDSGYTGGEVNE